MITNSNTQFPYLGRFLLTTVSCVPITFNPKIFGVAGNPSNLYLQKYCMGRLRFLHHMHNAASMRYSFPRFNTPSLRQPATTAPSSFHRPRELGSEMNPLGTCRSKRQANECDLIATSSQCHLRPCEGYGSETSLY